MTTSDRPCHIPSARDKTLKELQPMKEAIIKVAKEQSKSDRLKRLAELAGLEVKQSDSGQKAPFVYDRGNSSFVLYLDCDGESCAFPWDLSALGRLVIAVRLHESMCWPVNHVVKKVVSGYAVYAIGFQFIKVGPTKPTWADAVIAAMEEKHV